MSKKMKKYLEKHNIPLIKSQKKWKKTVTYLWERFENHGDNYLLMRRKKFVGVYRFNPKSGKAKLIYCVDPSVYGLSNTHKSMAMDIDTYVSICKMLEEQRFHEALHNRYKLESTKRSKKSK